MDEHIHTRNQSPIERKSLRFHIDSASRHLHSTKTSIIVTTFISVVSHGFVGSLFEGGVQTYNTVIKLVNIVATGNTC